MWLSQGDVWGLGGVSFTAPELWGEGWAGEAELMLSLSLKVQHEFG